MTAFSRVQDTVEATGFCWELRAVNHRYLDLSFRLPESFRHLETPLRQILREQVSRGKIECQLKTLCQSEFTQSIRLDESLVNHLLEVSANLAKSKNLQNDLTLSTLLNWPGVIQPVHFDSETMDERIMGLFQKALQALQKARTDEGQALKACMEKRLDLMQAEIDKTKAYVASKNLLDERDKFAARLEKLFLEVDPSRLEQEIALLLVKMDVSEELDRLGMHVQEIRKILEQETASGRRLDFLMQELHREANTLGSKSDSMELTQSSVEMKVLIDQLREQIQNIE